MDLRATSDFRSLLVPLGEYRKTHIPSSKGKKRKRDTKSAPLDTLKPPVPAIGLHVLIGINNVTKHLETLAASAAPPSVPINESNVYEQESSISDNGTRQRSKSLVTPLSFVILTHPQPSLSPSHAHIPTLLHLATLQHHPEASSSEPTRLISLPTSYEARIASALHIPRVGAIGIYNGAPGAKALEEYVREHVGLTHCAWVDEALEPAWHGLDVQQT